MISVIFCGNVVQALLRELFACLRQRPFQLGGSGNSS